MRLPTGLVRLNRFPFLHNSPSLFEINLSSEDDPLKREAPFDSTVYDSDIDDIAAAFHRLIAATSTSEWGRVMAWSVSSIPHWST